MCAENTGGPRISISFNLVDEALEGGRYGWGSATAGLELSLLEGDLSLQPCDAMDMTGRQEDFGAEVRAAEAGSNDAAGKSAGLQRIRAALAAAGREGQKPSELRSVLNLVVDETQALLKMIGDKASVD